MPREARAGGRGLHYPGASYRASADRQGKPREPEEASGKEHFFKKTFFALDAAKNDRYPAISPRKHKKRLFPCNSKG